MPTFFPAFIASGLVVALMVWLAKRGKPRTLRPH